MIRWNEDSNLLDLREQLRIGLRLIEDPKVLDTQRPFNHCYEVLDVLSLLEIACIIRAVSFRLPGEIQLYVSSVFKVRQVREIAIADPNLKLVTSLLARVAGRQAFYEEGFENLTSFIQFMILSSDLRRNDSVEFFLYKMTDSQTMEPFKRYLDSPEMFVEALVKSGDSSSLYSLLNGMNRFFRISIELHELLESLAEFELSQSALWFYNARLLRGLNSENLDFVIESLLKWQDEETDVLTRRMSRERLDLLTGAITELRSRKYEARLLHELRHLPSLADYRAYIEPDDSDEGGYEFEKA